MKNEKKIMLVGYGSVGQYALDFMLRTPELQDCSFFVVSRKSGEDTGIMERLNTSIVSAGLMGYYPRVKYVSADLNDISHMTSVLRNINPDVILYTGRFISGIKYGAYSYKNNLGYGLWTPLSITLIYKLCQAIQRSGVKAKLVNTSYPDAVNPILKSAGYDICTGAGNINHLVPRIKLAIADKYHLDPKDLEIKLVGSHYLNTYVSKEGTSKGSDYLLCIKPIKGTPLDYIPSELSKVFCEDIFSRCNIPMCSGHTRNLMVASDVARIARILVTGSSELIHLPGPDGLIGGYPCRYSEVYDKFIVDTRDTGFTRAGMEAINEQSLGKDGIDLIHSHKGCIEFKEESIIKFKEIFRYEYPRKIYLSEMENFAKDLQKVLKEYDEANEN